MREDLTLGRENAKKVMQAFRKNPDKFGFIDVTEEELWISFKRASKKSVN